jgi:hypothetical protein
MKASLLVAVGCSWVAAKAIDTDPTTTTINWSHQEDPAFVKQYSFAGLLQQNLGLDQIHFIAQSGSNNDEQLRKLVAFIDTNRDNYSRIFVLWGLTSIYRWEMFSSTINKVESCVAGSIPFNPNPEFRNEVKYYFSHFWNKEYELEKLGNSVLLASGYLTNMGIEHLFFNSFQAYNNNDLKISPVSNFYKVTETENDMLTFLCKTAGVSTNIEGLFLNFLAPNMEFPTHVRELQQQVLLDRATAHPTVQAHKLIADELYEYIKDNK